MRAKDLQAFDLLHIASRAFSGFGEALVRNDDRLFYSLCAAAMVRSDPNLEVTPTTANRRFGNKLIRVAEKSGNSGWRCDATDSSLHSESKSPRRWWA